VQAIGNGQRNVWFLENGISWTAMLGPDWCLSGIVKVLKPVT